MVPHEHDGVGMVPQGRDLCVSVERKEVGCSGNGSRG